MKQRQIQHDQPLSGLLQVNVQVFTSSVLKTSFQVESGVSLPSFVPAEDAIATIPKREGSDLRAVSALKGWVRMRGTVFEAAIVEALNIVVIARLPRGSAASRELSTRLKHDVVRSTSDGFRSPIISEACNGASKIEQLV